MAVREFIPTNFAPGTARRKLGRREAPYEHEMTFDAVRKRRSREEAPDAELVVVSQLQVARQRAKKKIENPAKKEVLMLRNGAKLGVVEPMTNVCYVQPGPRRRAVAGRGQLLCFPDKAKLYCAIDRSGARRCCRRLDLIDVVPRSHVWTP